MEKQEKTQKMTEAEWTKKLNEFIEYDNSFIGAINISRGTRDFPYEMPHRIKTVTEDHIRGYARGIMGDPDPMFIDPAYGKYTRYTSVIAPPTFVRAICETSFYPRQPQLPGVNLYYGGTTYDYSSNVPIRPGDTFAVIHKFLGFNEKHAYNKPYRLFTHVDEVTFINQRDQVVCICVGNEIITCTPPGAIEKMTNMLYKGREKKPYYSKETLDMIHRFYDDELAGKNRRGVKILYWEDVKVGEELPTVIEGPLSIGESVSYYAAIGGGGYGAFALNWQTLRNDLGHASIDPETGEYRQGVDWHYSDVVARTVGLPHAHGFGHMYEAGIAHLLCNWMGDDGWVKKLALQHRNTRFFGDMAYIKGKITAKRVENDEHVVDLDVQLVNQDGLIITPGTATVRLLSRK
jgi:acyl dehydratase